MSEKLSLEFSASVSPQEAAGYLEALARSLREGSALLESGDQSLRLEMGSNVKLKLEADTDPDKGKGSLDVSLSWRLAEQAEAPASLVIVAGAPVPAGVAAEED
jgi:amphi-Trp domain-containing protein